MEYEVKALARNVLYIEQDARGYSHLRRFLPEQEAAYQTNGMYRAVARAACGSCLAFKSKPQKITLLCTLPEEAETMTADEKVTPYEKSPTFQETNLLPQSEKGESAPKVLFGNCFDVYVNGERKSQVETKEGELTFLIEGDVGQEAEVEIFFPIFFDVGIRDIRSETAVSEWPTAERRILCMGDSITAGMIAMHTAEMYAVRLAKALHMELVNQGVGGYVYCRDSLKGLEQVAEQFSLVTVAYGTNDWAYANDKTDAYGAVEDYLARLAEIFPQTPIVVMTPLWRIDEDTHTPVGSMAAWREHIRNTALSYPQMQVVDGDEMMDHETSLLADCFVHPDDRGHRMVAERLARKIKTK